MHDSFDQVFDIVVVGYGAAGAAAAITARDLGLSVAIIEKQAEFRHFSNTRMSAGLIMTVSDPEAATAYLVRCAGGMVPVEANRSLATRAAGLHEWLDRVTPTLGLARVNGAEHDFPGAEFISAYQPANARFRLDPEVQSGLHLDACLKEAVASREVPVFWETPATHLRRNGGRVNGVEVQSGAGALAIGGRMGVVLAAGGFEFDEAAKQSYLRAYPMYFYGNPGNSGDGVRMAQEVGADLWHMNQIVGRGIMHFVLPEGTPAGFFTTINPPGYVITDVAGRRFANEDDQAALLHSFYYDLLTFDPEKGVYPRVPCYWFFDETRRKAAPLIPPYNGVSAVGLYTWSPDNSREIERGWIARADTIAALAQLVGIDDPQAAADTIAQYNETCRSGAPDPFGRAKKTMVPISEPPFYCVRLWPGGSNTTGGPRRDEFGRILDAFGRPIGGLFGAGELGQVSGLIYPADGFNIAEALCFGQIAVETALADDRANVPRS